MSDILEDAELDGALLDDLEASLEDDPQHEGSGQVLTESTPPNQVAAWILESREDIKYGSDTLTVAMDLPSLARIGADTFLKALEIVLAEFSIRLPADIRSAIKAGGRWVNSTPGKSAISISAASA